jgi:GAF domain-containing protein
MSINDPERLAALRKTGLLDSPPDPGFEQLAQTWARMLDVPVALVSLVDEDRQYFASVCGQLPETVAATRQTPLSHSFCKHVVESKQPLIVNDAREHPVLKDNPAIEEYGVIAYAGMPLVTPEGHVLGTLCFIDSKPRDWNIKAGSIVFRPRGVQQATNAEEKDGHVK